MRVERLFANYQDKDGNIKNDVKRKAAFLGHTENILSLDIETEAKSAIIKHDLPTPNNLAQNQVVVLLFIGRSQWLRCCATKEHAAMFYRAPLTIAAGEEEKICYISLYPGETPSCSSAVQCVLPEFKDGQADLVDLFQASGNELHEIEAYRITFDNNDEVIAMHDSYKRMLDANGNVLFDQWGRDRNSGISAYFPETRLSTAVPYLLCYWGAGCSWLRCCFNQPSKNCVSLIIDLLEQSGLYPSASAYSQRITGVGHVLMILSMGVLFSEFARLVDLEYPLERSDDTVKYCLGFIGASFLVSLSTYGLDAEVIQSFLPYIFCCLSVKKSATLPAEIYLSISSIAAVIAAIVFIVRGVEHGFQKQADSLEHVPVIWGLFSVGIAATFALYSMFACCTSETLSCSRPITLHRDLRRMTFFSEARDTEIVFAAPPYQPPQLDIEAGVTASPIAGNSFSESAGSGIRLATAPRK